MDYQPPKIGDTKVTCRYIANLDKWIVGVNIFKANTLRGDAYWTPVPNAFRTFRKEADARRFAARFA